MSESRRLETLDDCAAKVHSPDVLLDGEGYDPALFERLDGAVEAEEDPGRKPVAGFNQNAHTTEVRHSSEDGLFEARMGKRDSSNAETEKVSDYKETVGSTQNVCTGAIRDGSAPEDNLLEELLRDPAFANVLDDRNNSNCNSSIVSKSPVGCKRKADAAVTHIQTMRDDASNYEVSQKRKTNVRQQPKLPPSETPKRNFIYMGQYATKGAFYTQAHELFLKEVKVWQCRNRRNQLKKHFEDSSKLLGSINYLLGRVEAKIKEKPVLFHRPSANNCTRLVLNEDSNEKSRGPEHRRIVREFLLGNKGPLLKEPLEHAEKQLEGYKDYLTDQAFSLLVHTSQRYVRSVSSEAALKEVETRGFLRTLNDLLAKMLRESGLEGGSSMSLESKHLLDYDEPPGLNHLFEWDSDDESDSDSDFAFGGTSSQPCSCQKSFHKESNGMDPGLNTSDSSCDDTSSTASRSPCKEDDLGKRLLTYSQKSHDSVSDLSLSDASSAGDASGLPRTCETTSSRSDERKVPAAIKARNAGHDQNCRSLLDTRSEPYRAKNYLDGSRNVYTEDLYLDLRERQVTFVSPDTYRPEASYLPYRRYLVDWMSDVGELYKLSNTTIHVSVLYLDKIFRSTDIPRNQWQLLASACITVASKYEEAEERIPSIPEFLRSTKLSNVGHTLQSFWEGELEVLRRLDWKLFAVPPIRVTEEYYVQNGVCFVNDSWEKQALVPKIPQYVKKYVDFFCALVLQEYSFQQYPPTKLAAAVVMASRAVLDLKPRWRPELTYLTGYEEEELIPIYNHVWSFYEEQFPEHAGSGFPSEHGVGSNSPCFVASVLPV